MRDPITGIGFSDQLSFRIVCVLTGRIRDNWDTYSSLPGEIDTRYVTGYTHRP